MFQTFCLPLLSFCSSSHSTIYRYISSLCIAATRLFILDALWNTFFQKLFYSCVSPIHCVRKCVCVVFIPRLVRLCSISCISASVILQSYCARSTIRLLSYIFFGLRFFSSSFHQFLFYYILLTAVVCACTLLNVISSCESFIHFYLCVVTNGIDII